MSAVREHSHGHVHTHGVTDPLVLSTERGIWAVKWSFVGLLLTALVQSGIVLLSGSVALLADTVHNFGDAATSLPLWLAFLMTRRGANSRFTYGYGRLEDLAGVLVVVAILASGLAVGYQSIVRFLDPQPVGYLWAVALAAGIGFVGNEAVARLRINVGREIGSAALVADGQHARVDALTSLGVLLSAGGLWLGYAMADPVVGLVISLVILRIAWESGEIVFLRLLDAVEPGTVHEITETAGRTSGVVEVSEVRVRWIGHRLHAELNVAVDGDLTVERAHEIAMAARHALLHQLRYLSTVTVHVDPLTASGEGHHRILNHAHDEHSTHSH